MEKSKSAHKGKKGKQPVVGSHEEETSRSNYESKSAILPPPKAPVTNTSTTEDRETQCSNAAKDSLEEDSEGSGSSSATITQESGKKKGTAYPSKLPSPERFIVPPSFARKDQKKNASVSLHYPQYFSALLAYSGTTAENVIRPCIVTNLIEAPFVQWFGFLRCPNDGVLRVFAYDRISGPIHNLPKSFKLSQGIPFSKNIIDDVQHSVRKDVFTNEDPAKFATYRLSPLHHNLEFVYIIRLLCSVKLWKRIAERLWWWANRLNTIPTFEMFRLQREYWLQKTSNIRVAFIKLNLSLHAIKNLLRECHLLDPLIEEISLVDEEDENVSIRTPAVRNLGPTLLEWVRNSRKCSMSAMLGRDGEGDTEFRWLYEDWPRPRSILPGNPVHCGDVNVVNNQISIRPTNKDLLGNDIGPSRKQAAIGEQYEIWINDGVAINRRSHNTNKNLDPYARKLIENLEKAVGSRIRITISPETTIEGTMISISDTHLAFADLDSPPDLFFISLDTILKWETQHWNDRIDYKGVASEKTIDDLPNEQQVDGGAPGDGAVIVKDDDYKEWPRLKTRGWFGESGRIR